MPLSSRQREATKRRASYRCEYCHIVGWELQVDHIFPRSRRRSGELDDLDAAENLAAACSHCNRLKGDAIKGRDALTGHEARLFNPRMDAWEEHFAWSKDFLRVLPLTEIGGATVARLKMNEPLLRRQRQLLRQAMAGGAPPWP